MYYSNPEGWNVTQRPGYLEQVAEHLNGIRITCGDYEPVLTEPGEKVWIYLDPPYVVDTNFNNGSKLYQYGFTNEDHIRFAEVCKKSPHKLCISYDDNPFIRELFKDFYIYSHSWKYCGSSQKTKSVGKELVITNYERPGEQGKLDELYLKCENMFD